MSEVIDYGAKGQGETKILNMLEGESFDQAKDRLETSGYVVVDAAVYDDREGRHRVIEVAASADERQRVELMKLGHGPVEEQRAA